MFIDNSVFNLICSINLRNMKQMKVNSALKKHRK